MYLINNEGNDVKSVIPKRIPLAFIAQFLSGPFIIVWRVSTTTGYVGEIATIDLCLHDHRVSDNLRNLTSLPPRDFWYKINVSWDLEDDRNT